MRLNFNVLWIDDQPAQVASSQEAIARRMLTQGFNLEPYSTTSINGAREYMSDDVLLDEIDLVLVDYNLGGGATGDYALVEIREKLPYRDVIFYSANASKDLKDKAHEQKIEGVYCASREDLVDTVIGVFEVLIKKALDIDHMRGIVMGATADIDILVHDCLLAINVSLAKDKKEELLAQARKRVDKKTNSWLDLIIAAMEKPAFEDLLSDKAALTANSKLKFLIRLLKNNNFKSLKEDREALLEYSCKIIPKRNILAHAKLIPVNGSKVFHGRNEKQITSEEMRDLRISLINHREIFTGLLESLRGTND